MSAEVIPFPCETFEPVRVELSSPGTRDGRPFYFVDYVEANGGRSGMWSGDSYEAAVEAATDCARNEDGTCLPIVDRVVGGALAAPDDLKRELVEEARLTFNDEAATELAEALGVDPVPTTKH